MANLITLNTCTTQSLSLSAEEAKKKKFALLEARVEANTRKKAHAMASRTKDNLKVRPRANMALAKLYSNHVCFLISFMTYLLSRLLKIISKIIL